MGGLGFCKIQAPNGIPVMISMSKAEAISLKACGNNTGLNRWRQGDGTLHSGKQTESPLQ